MRLLIAIVILIACLSCEISKNDQQVNEVENLVSKMNSALANHQSDILLTCYSTEMNWENSFGWTIRNKEILSSYFEDWLFPRYPELEEDRLGLKYETEFIKKDVVWVDVLQEIRSEDLSTVVRTYRQTHLVVKKDGDWLIKKTRLWLPTQNSNPPVKFLSSHSYFD